MSEWSLTRPNTLIGKYYWPGKSKLLVLGEITAVGDNLNAALSCHACPAVADVEDARALCTWVDRPPYLNEKDTADPAEDGVWGGSRIGSHPHARPERSEEQIIVLTRTRPSSSYLKVDLLSPHPTA